MMRLSALVSALAFLTISLSISNSIYGQAEMVWQHQLPCSGTCAPPIMAVTDSGYVYVAYTWDGDLALYKYDPIGNFKWDRLYGDGGDTRTWPRRITVDKAGAVYISGDYSSDETTTAPETAAFFTVKYSSDGTLVWEDAYAFNGHGGSGWVNGQVLSSDETALYLAGYSNLIWDPFPYTSSCPEYYNKEVLIKYNTSAGNREWLIDSVGFVMDLFPDQSGGVYSAATLEIDKGCCVDSLTGDSSMWAQYAATVAHYGSNGTELGLAIFSDTSFIECDEEFNENHRSVRVMTGDDLGNIYVIVYHRDSSDFVPYLYKFNSAVSLEWVSQAGLQHSSTYRPDLLVDRAGDIVFADQFATHKFNNGGGFIWEGQPGRFLGVDGDNNLYIGSYYENTVDYYDHNEVDEYPEWAVTSPGGSLWDLFVDSLGHIYTTNKDGYSVRVGMFAQYHTVGLRDGNNDSIPNMEYQLIRMSGPPLFTEDTLGTLMTDSLGRFTIDYIDEGVMEFKEDPFDIEPDTLTIGDTIKISRAVFDSAAVKHPVDLATMLSVHIDNLHLDSLGGIRANVNELKSGPQNISIEHTEYRFNLMVSIEWDASEDYLWGLQHNFRQASNYLYDVSDGQIRLDTVMIFDDGDRWLDTDIWIFASNTHWPCASVFGTLWNNPGSTVELPRLFLGEEPECLDSSYHNYPYDMDVPNDYRTKIHEFGHYALGFWDEYLFFDHIDPSSGDSVYTQTNRCPGITLYGFMDNSDVTQGPEAEYASEMSDVARYGDANCSNTEQYLRRNNKSCWEWFESKAELTYEIDPVDSDSLLIPIWRPEEQWLPSGYEYLAGPNDDMDNLDYDVGALVVFPEPVTGPAPGVRDFDARILTLSGDSASYAEVILQKPVVGGGWRDIKQGKTASNGHIWVLGAADGDRISSTHGSFVVSPLAVTRLAGSKVWNYGSMAISSDTGTLIMNAVQGEYPMISYVELGGTDVTYHLDMSAPFSATPALVHRSFGENESQYGFVASEEGYMATITDYPGHAGGLEILAVDDGDNEFFIPTSYTLYQSDSTQTVREAVGPGGESEITFSGGVTALERVMILSSAYPPMRTGIDPDAIQAGKIHNVAIYPEGSLSKSGTMEIRYPDQDITSAGGSESDEASLRVFQWMGSATGWELLGGDVDTTENQLAFTIGEPGVYAAFTTNTPVDVEDEEQGNVLPYRFELSQNYPNPFNPMTTIDYSLPRRSQVTIKVYNVLGQKVRTLVDREESAGSYTVTWDGTTVDGQATSTGVYIYRFQAGDHVETKKMLLLK